MSRSGKPAWHGFALIDAHLAPNAYLHPPPSSRPPLAGLDTMRKICNHPDLLQLKWPPDQRVADYGNIERSGKLKVAEFWGKKCGRGGE